VSAGERPRPEQALLVVACLAAVVVATAAVPGVAGPGESEGGASDGGGSSGQATRPGGGDGGGGVGVGDILRWLFGGERASAPRPVPPEYDVTVRPEPVPGRTVTVTVRQRGDPVAGATVAFGDRPVGRTDADGEVRGRVPYDDGELVVRVQPPGEAAAPQRAGVAGAAAGPTGGVGRQTEPTPTPSNVTERYDLPTSATLRVVGTPDPGATLRVVARVAGDPLPGAAVRVNGERVGRTNASGTRAVRVPDDGTRRLRLRVERGAVTGERTVAVRLLTVRVDPTDPLAVPTRPATVETRVGGDPAANATLAVGGERAGRTGETGRARVTLPADPTAAVVARRGDRVARRSLLPAYATTGAAVALPMLALAGGVGWVVRHRAAVTRGAGRAGRGLVAAARLLGRGVAALARAAWRVAVAVGSGMFALLGWLARVPARLAARVSPRAALVAVLAVPRLLAGVPRRAVAGLRDGREAGPSEGEERSPQVGDSPDFEALWLALARAVAPDGWRHRTPAEVARAAVDRGLPADGVARVTRAYRQRLYAPDDPPGDEAARAVETLRALVAEAGDDGEEER
jgi:hypothetical protein